MKRLIDRGKRSKTLSKIEPFENISKNLKNFLEIRLMQKEALPPNELQDHAYE